MYADNCTDAVDRLLITLWAMSATYLDERSFTLPYLGQIQIFELNPGCKELTIRSAGAFNFCLSLNQSSGISVLDTKGTFINYNLEGQQIRLANESNFLVPPMRICGKFGFPPTRGSEPGVRIGIYQCLCSYFTCFKEKKIICKNQDCQWSKKFSSTPYRHASKFSVPPILIPQKVRFPPPLICRPRLV